MHAIHFCMGKTSANRFLGLPNVQVGFVESIEQQVRQSGAGAWSLRVHDRLVDIPYAEFAKRFPPEEVPFHRIAYFKEHNSILWWVSLGTCFK